MVYEDVFILDGIEFNKEKIKQALKYTFPEYFI